MQDATSQTVLADFNNKWYRESGQNFRPYRQGEQFFVETENEIGELQSYEVRWTFGVAPFQQYMIEFPSKELKAVKEPNLQMIARPNSYKELDRVQVLRWSWDTQKKTWFHLDPPNVHGNLAPDDQLAWTGPMQRWNSMCAVCHSTNLKKGFDVANQTYQTSFDEIDVSCESCHGPASIHLQIAERWLYQKDPIYGHGLADLKSSLLDQIDSCAPCHSRRNQIAEGHISGDSFNDYFKVSLLTQELYFDDGQAKDEVYIHGSFLQSKMYHKGIRCTDCHDPHSAKLKQSGNQVCTSCHQHAAFKYDSPSHHFHQPNTAGALCVNCHMPSTTYMEVDPRRDHSFRIPRPDFSISLGTPNACTGCHLKPENVSAEVRGSLTQYLDWMLLAKDEPTVEKEIKRADAWCEEACQRWYGENRKKPYHFASALHAARTEPPQSSAVALLRELISKRGHEAPAIARATALQELLKIDPKAAVEEGILARDDASAIVRSAAASTLLGEVDIDQRWNKLRPLLNDPARAVRIEAAKAAATLLPHVQPFLSPVARRALDEYRAAMQLNNDRSSGNLGLGKLEEQLGNLDAALKHYESAIEVEPGVFGPRTNYATLLESLATKNASNVELSASLKARADKLRLEEIPLLERDVRLSPKNASLAYRLGLAYFLQGQVEEAIGQLRQATELEPRSADFALAYILVLEKAGNIDTAIQEANRALQFEPNNQELQSTLKTLQSY